MSRHFRPVLGALLFSLTLVAGLSRLAWAAGGSCDHCGEVVVCQKICRLVQADRKITTTCWGLKCEDFCAPGRSTPGCKNCEIVYDEDDPKKPCVQPKKLVWTDWLPGHSGTVYTKKKLMKKTVTKVVPGYKWVVEELCQQCEAHCQAISVAPGTQVPPVPAVENTKILPPQPMPAPTRPAQ